MDAHPNFARVQRGWDDIAGGDPTVALESLSEGLIYENSPKGVRHLEGKSAFVALLASLYQLFQGISGRKAAAFTPMRRALSRLLTSTARSRTVTATNQIVFVMRFAPSGLVDRIWSMDLNDEAVAAFRRMGYLRDAVQGAATDG